MFDPDIDTDTDVDEDHTKAPLKTLLFPRPVIITESSTKAEGYAP
ncbi:MAG: hypothetical protein ACOZBW_04505 [Thermodesulfobacteriota bacterium]